MVKAHDPLVNHSPTADALSRMHCRRVVACFLGITVVMRNSARPSAADLRSRSSGRQAVIRRVHNVSCEKATISRWVRTTNSAKSPSFYRAEHAPIESRRVLDRPHPAQIAHSHYFTHDGAFHTLPERRWQSVRAPGTPACRLSPGTLCVAPAFSNWQSVAQQRVSRFCFCFCSPTHGDSRRTRPRKIIRKLVGRVWFLYFSVAFCDSW